MNLIINKPYIDGNKLVSKIEYDDKKYDMYFEVEDKFLEYLCDDNENAFLIALIPFIVKHNYDVVNGAMADDQVYNYITDLMAGNITRTAFWELAKFRHPTHQIALCTEQALNCIKYIGSEEL